MMRDIASDPETCLARAGYPSSSPRKSTCSGCLFSSPERSFCTAGDCSTRRSCPALTTGTGKSGSVRLYRDAPQSAGMR